MNGALEEAASLEAIGEIERAPDAERKPRTPALVLGVAALTMLFVAQILQLLPALEGLQVAKVTALLVVILFLASKEGFQSRVPVRSSPPLKYIIGILVLACATAPFAVWPSAALKYILDVFIKNIIFVYLVVQVARSDRAARVVAGALVAGCSAIVVAMIAGVGPLVTYEEQSRVSVGGTYDPNDLALLFVVAIPFAFFMLKASSARARLLLIFAIGLMFLGIVATGSRGGFLGLIVIGCLILFRASKQARKYALVTLAVGVLLFAFAAPPSYWERIGTILEYEQDYNMTDKGGRIMIWRTGLDMIASHPFTGVGISCFPVAHVRFSPFKLQAAAHNTALQVTAELGIAGLMLFLLIVFSSLRAARAVRRRASQGSAEAEFLWLASAIEVSFIGFLVSAFFLTHAYSAIFCFLVGMSGALVARYKSAREQQEMGVEEIEYA